MERIVRRIRVRCTVEEEQREWEREKGEKEPERGGAPDSWSMSKKKEEERDIFLLQCIPIIWMWNGFSI